MHWCFVPNVKRSSVPVLLPFNTAHQKAAMSQPIYSKGKNESWKGGKIFLKVLQCRNFSKSAPFRYLWAIAEVSCSGNGSQKIYSAPLRIQICIWHLGKAWTIKWGFKDYKCVESFKAICLNDRNTEVSLLLKAFEKHNRERYMKKCLLRVYNWSSHICVRIEVCCLLMAEAVKALWSANAEMQFILLPLEEIPVKIHCDQQYVALLLAQEGNVFSALENSRVDFKPSCCTSIAVQEWDFGYKMLCKKHQMSFLWCSKYLFPRKRYLSKYLSIFFQEKSTSEQMWNNTGRDRP